MAELIRNTKETFVGPWLFDSAALVALDEIIDEQWARLEAHRKRQIDNATRRERYLLSKSDSNRELSADERKLVDKEVRQRAENDDRYADDGRTITLTFSSGAKVRVNSFREVAKDVNCQGHEVAKVEVRLYCGGIRGDLVVPTADKFHSLSLVTLPEGSDAAVELFVRLQMWADQYKPDWFRQTCGMGAQGAWFLAFLLGLLCFTLAAATIPDTWKDEVRELLAKGVKPEDYGRALELVLRESAGLRAENQTIHFPFWFFAATVTVVIVASLLSVRARTAFEIGKGAASVRWQKRYDAFLRKIIPSFLIFGVLASVLGSWAYDLLRSK